MARLKYAEIAAVEGGDARDVQALCHSHDAAIDNVKLGVGIHACDFPHSVQVVPFKSRELGIQTREIFKESLYTVISEVTPEKISSFWQDDIGHYPTLSVLLPKARCLVMKSVFGVIQCDEETAIDQECHESIRLFK